MWRRPEISLIALFAAVLGFALVRVPDGGTPNSSMEWLFLAPVCVGIVLFVLRRTAGRFRRFWPILVLPACIAIQFLPGPLHTVSVSLTLAQLARVLVYLSCFLALREMTSMHPGSEWMLLAPPVAFGVAEAVFGIAQHAIRGTDNYAVGTFGDHSHFAGFIELLLPVAIVGAIHYRRLLLVALPLVFFAALLHSLSRGALAASTLALVLMVLVGTRRFMLTAAAAAALMLAALLLAPSGWGERFRRISTMEGFRDDAQMARWNDTLRLIAARPVFGSGAGTYPVAFAPYNTSAKPDVQYADNDYLQLLAEFGIAGTFAALTLLAFALRRCVLASSWNLAALGAMGSIIALLGHSVFEFQLYIPANVLTLAWIAGVGCGVSRARIRERGSLYVTARASR